MAHGRHRRKHYNGCRDKARYETAEEAKAEQPAQRPYLCQACKCWHLTSQVIY